MHFCFIKKQFLEYLAQTSPTPPMYHFTKAKGVYLFDKKGNKYIDLISGIAVNNIGHSNKKVLKAIKMQSQRFMHQMVYGEYVITPQVKLAKLLSDHLPDALNSVYFLNSGSESVEGALKLAKKYTGKKKIVALKNAYHGSTSGALSLMSDEYYSGPFKPLLPNVYFAELNNHQSLNLIDDNTACLILEPIQAESGYHPATQKFLEDAREKCTKNNALLIFDEIQSGMGRTGNLFAFEQYGVVPDVLLTAKALGGGMPLSAFISSKQIMSSLTDNPILGHITTFGGHPVSAAAAIASLTYIRDKDLMVEVDDKESLFRQLLKHPKIKAVTGKGLMLAVHVENFDQVEFVMKHCIENGVIIDWFLYNQNALRVSPPLIISEKQITKVCNTIINALNKL